MGNPPRIVASVTFLVPIFPADAMRLIQRCLEKDRESRMHTARDVTTELHDIARRPSSAARSGLVQPERR